MLLIMNECSDLDTASWYWQMDPVVWGVVLVKYQHDRATNGVSCGPCVLIRISVTRQLQFEAEQHSCAAGPWNADCSCTYHLDQSSEYCCSALQDELNQALQDFICMCVIHINLSTSKRHRC